MRNERAVPPDACVRVAQAALTVARAGSHARAGRTTQAGHDAILRLLLLMLCLALAPLAQAAPRALAAQLWALHHDGDVSGFDELPALAASGRTSFKANTTIPHDLYRVLGYRLCQDRAVRVLALASNSV